MFSWAGPVQGVKEVLQEAIHGTPPSRTRAEAELGSGASRSGQNGTVEEQVAESERGTAALVWVLVHCT